MAAELAPAFQFYPRDFMAASSVQAMDLRVVGGYLKLLCWSWLDDGLDPALLPTYQKALTLSDPEWTDLWGQLEPRFPLAEDGRHRNPRQEEERAKQRQWREKSARGGRKSHPTHTPSDQPEPHPNHCSTTVQPPFNTAFASASACTTPHTGDDGAAGRAYGYLQTQAVAVRKVNLTLTPRPADAQSAMEFVTRYPDQAQQERLIDAYLRSDHKPIRAVPVTMGQVAKWASWLEEHLAPPGGGDPWWKHCPHTPVCERLSDCRLKLAKDGAA